MKRFSTILLAVLTTIAPIASAGDGPWAFGPMGDVTATPREPTAASTVGEIAVGTVGAALTATLGTLVAYGLFVPSPGSYDGVGVPPSFIVVIAGGPPIFGALGAVYSTHWYSALRRERSSLKRRTIGAAVGQVLAAGGVVAWWVVWGDSYAPLPLLAVGPSLGAVVGNRLGSGRAGTSAMRLASASARSDPPLITGPTVGIQRSAFTGNPRWAMNVATVRF